MSTSVTTLTLLVASNLFMTAAWYGHLRFKETAHESVAFVLVLAAVVVASLPVR